MENIEIIVKTIRSLTEQYKKDISLENLQRGLVSFAEVYKDYFGIGDLLVFEGEQLINAGHYDAGILFIKTTADEFQYIANSVTLYLRMAEYHLEKGDTEKGTEFLIRLCTETVENYKESIDNNELNGVWEKYRHLVTDKVPLSVRFNSRTVPLSRDECSMQIGDILNLPKDQRLTALSEHLAERSANGDHTENLNEREQTVFEADTFCTEVNSGGILHYLYYYGDRFNRAVEAFETIGAGRMLTLAKKIRRKFPKSKVPAKLGQIQDVLDKLEEEGVDFEEEERVYYNLAEPELLEKMLRFIEENQEQF